MADLQPDAIIFVPGLGDWYDQSVDGIAHRIACSLDRGSPTIQAQFYPKSETVDENLGPDSQPGRKTRVRTVYRRDGERETPVLDVYELQYQEALTYNFKGLNPAMQSLRLFLLMLSNWRRLLSPEERLAKGGIAKTQFYIALGIVLLLFAYMVLLFGAAVVVVLQVLGLVTVSFDQWLLTLPAVVVVLAVVQALFPGLREGLKKAALTYTCVVEYIAEGGRRDVIAGLFSDLLEHVAEKNKYRNIHIIAYSFGSIIALDSLFPSGRKPGERFKLVSTLVTIGCPFDLIRMFWKDYFQMRAAWPGRPQRWINVYCPADALASNFRNDDDQKPANVGLNLTQNGPCLPENVVYHRGPDSIGAMAALALAGLRAHANYWEIEYEAEISCFNDIVLALYQDDPVLQ